MFTTGKQVIVSARNILSPHTQKTGNATLVHITLLIHSSSRRFLFTVHQNHFIPFGRSAHRAEPGGAGSLLLGESSFIRSSRCSTNRKCGFNRTVCRTTSSFATKSHHGCFAWSKRCSLTFMQKQSGCKNTEAEVDMKERKTMTGLTSN